MSKRGGGWKQSRKQQNRGRGNGWPKSRGRGSRRGQPRMEHTPKHIDNGRPWRHRVRRDVEQARRPPVAGPAYRQRHPIQTAAQRDAARGGRRGAHVRGPIRPPMRNYPAAARDAQGPHVFFQEPHQVTVVRQRAHLPVATIRPLQMASAATAVASVAHFGNPDPSAATASGVVHGGHFGQQVIAYVPHGGERLAHARVLQPQVATGTGLVAVMKPVNAATAPSQFSLRKTLEVMGRFPAETQRQAASILQKIMSGVPLSAQTPHRSSVATQPPTPNEVSPTASGKSLSACAKPPTAAKKPTAVKKQPLTKVVSYDCETSADLIEGDFGLPMDDSIWKRLNHLEEVFAEKKPQRDAVFSKMPEHFVVCYEDGVRIHHCLQCVQTLTASPPTLKIEPHFIGRKILVPISKPSKKRTETSETEGSDSIEKKTPPPSQSLEYANVAIKDNMASASDKGTAKSIPQLTPMAIITELFAVLDPILANTALLIWKPILEKGIAIVDTNALEESKFAVRFFTHAVLDESRVVTPHLMPRSSCLSLQMDMSSLLRSAKGVRPLVSFQKYATAKARRKTKGSIQSSTLSHIQLRIRQTESLEKEKEKKMKSCLKSASATGTVTSATAVQPFVSIEMAPTLLPPNAVFTHTSSTAEEMEALSYYRPVLGAVAESEPL